MADWIEPRNPFTRMSCVGGAICGISAETAGIWTPAPADRTASTTKISHGSVKPASMTMARNSVEAAIAASAPMISHFRLCRSAHTPPNSDTTAWGRNPNAAARVIITPDWNWIARYQNTAYWTSIEPNRLTVWPPRKAPTWRFQCGCVTSAVADGSGTSVSAGAGAAGWVSVMGSLT